MLLDCGITKYAELECRITYIGMVRKLRHKVLGRRYKTVMKVDYPVLFQ